MEHLRDFEGSELVHAEPTLSFAEVHLVVQFASHDLLILVRFEPLDALSFFPKAEFCGLARHDVGAKAVLLAAAPVAAVSAPVGPRVDAVAVLFVILVLTAVLSAVLPCVHTDAVHIIIDPFSLILASI